MDVINAAIEVVEAPRLNISMAVILLVLSALWGTTISHPGAIFVAPVDLTLAIVPFMYMTILPPRRAP